MKFYNVLCVVGVILMNKVTRIYSEFDVDDIFNKVPKWENLNLTAENVYVLKQKLKNDQKLIDNVAYRGDKQKDYRITLRDLNLLTRKNYAEMVKHVGYNIFPLLVATDAGRKLSGVGGEFTLFLRNGTVLTSKPSPSVYEINKDIAHLSVGIFAIVSPFFNNPTSPMWHGKLREYQKHIQSTLAHLRIQNKMPPTSHSVNCEDNLTNEEQAKMFSMTNNYIEDCFRRQSVDHFSFRAYSNNFRRYIYKSLKCPVKVQAMAAIRQLKIWKDQLGEEWDGLYVLIPAIWTVARTNPRREIIELFMSEDKRITNIITTEGAKSIQEAREVLGRVIADRTMSEMIFRHNDENNILQNVALSTKTDKVALSTEAVLKTLNTSTMTLSDSYDQPNDIRFDDVYQVPEY